MKRIVFVVPMLLATSGFALADPPPKESTPKAAARAEQLKAGVKSFRLRLDYNGESDKPYYSLTLSVPGLPPMDKGFTTRKEPFSPQVQITEEQAKKVIDYLAAEGFLDRADERKPGALIAYPAPKMPGYTMKVDAGQVVFYDDLGWGLPMLKRLDGLRKVLDGDAATQMDLLLGRLSGHRREWEKAVTRTLAPDVPRRRAIWWRLNPPDIKKFTELLTAEDKSPWKDEDYLHAATLCVHLATPANEDDWKLLAKPEDFASVKMNMDSVGLGVAKQKEAAKQIVAPKIERKDGWVTVTFYAWHFIGKNFSRWRVQIGPKVEASKQELDLFGGGGYD